VLKQKKGPRQATHQMARGVFREAKFVHEEVVDFAVEVYFERIEEWQASK